MTAPGILVGISNEVGRGLAARLPEGVGFCLLIFDFPQGDDFGATGYSTNASSEGAINLLRGMLETLEAEAAEAGRGQTADEPGRPQ